MKRHVVFDLETTGFQHSEGHRIVEIGAVEVLDGRPTENTFHVYVNPDREVPEDAVKVHGLTSEFLSDKPLFNDATVAKSFLNFISGATLIAHNGKAFDLPFLNDELAANNLGVVDNELIDTLIMARKKFPGSPASLDALCSRFGIDTSEREAEGHGALLDSILLCKVYLELT